MHKFVVGVMGEGEGANPELILLARRLGQLIAEQGWILLSGGRDVGVMKAVNDGAKYVPGSLTVGILPSSESKASPNVDIAIVTDMHSARNNINVLSSDVVVACGSGGAGTVSEIALALKAQKFVILLNGNDIAQKFFKQLGNENLFTVQTPEEVIDTIIKLGLGSRNS
jgi:uncharacterized protein (TIGR00725 family)